MHGQVFIMARLALKCDTCISFSYDSQKCEILHSNCTILINILHAHLVPMNYISCSKDFDIIYLDALFLKLLKGGSLKSCSRPILQQDLDSICLTYIPCFIDFTIFSYIISHYGVFLYISDTGNWYCETLQHSSNMHMCYDLVS